MSTALFRLGWTTALADAFAPFAAQGLFPARVALEHTHIYRVIGESGESLARVSGRLRHRAHARADFPAVGDWVAVHPPERSGDSRIVAVLPRRSRFSRRAAGDPTKNRWSRQTSTPCCLSPALTAISIPDGWNAICWW